VADLDRAWFQAAKHYDARWYSQHDEHGPRIELMAKVPIVLCARMGQSFEDDFILNTYCSCATYQPTPAFRIAPGKALSPFGRLFGMQDVVLSKEKNLFDERFVVKTKDAAALRSLWKPNTRQRMALALSDASIECNGSTIELTRRGLYTEIEQLIAILDVMTSLINADVYGQEALRAVAITGLRTDKNGRPFVELATPAQVTIQAEPIEGHLVTVARLREKQPLRNMSLKIEDGVPKEGQEMTALPPNAQARLFGVGSGTFVVKSGKAHFQWDAVQADPATLQAGANLLGALVTGGPLRF
jgi:hypothetical protein